MIRKIVERCIAGIAFGGIATFIALTIMKFGHIEGYASEIWNHMLASFGIGIYFGLASLIFEMETGSPLKKTAIHYCLSIVVWLIIALPVGWLPFNLVSVIVWILSFTIIYIIFLTLFYLYFIKFYLSIK